MSDRQWGFVSLAAIIAMVVIVVGQLFLPKQSLKKLTQTKRNEETKLKTDIERLRTDVSALRVKNERRLWLIPADQVSAAAMARVTEIAQGKSLKVLAFRPQRTVEDTGVVRLPYQISLDGSFAQVVAFVKEMETPKYKLPVVSVQLAAADGATDRVTATIGIVAYREQEK